MQILQKFMKEREEVCWSHLKDYHPQNNIAECRKAFCKVDAWVSIMWLAALLTAAKTAAKTAAAAKQQYRPKTIHTAAAKTAVTALF